MKAEGRSMKAEGRRKKVAERLSRRVAGNAGSLKGFEGGSELETPSMRRNRRKVRHPPSGVVFRGRFYAVKCVT
jgi:hypothetical protein